MKNNPLVSIIVPVYNVELYLEECLESIIKTEIREIEIIVIDDGSTDNSNQIIKSYSKKDPRIKVIEKENGGLSSARNAGLSIARGQYILFIDSDDLLYPEALSKALENARINNSDIIICDYFEFEDLSNVKYRYDRAFIPEGVLRDHNSIINKLFFLDIDFASSNKLYRHRFLLDNSLSFKANTWFEDLDFGFRAFYNAKIISKENSVIFGYRQRKGSIMRTVSPKVLDKKTVLYEIKSFLESHKEMRTFEDGFKYLFFKMYISIVYQVLKNSGPLSDKQDILKHIFSDSYFYTEVLRNSRILSQISLIEKLLYMQLKFRILNLKTLPIYNSFI